ncbi:MAG: hypothetical protein M5U28_23050 [Sandaracinaceae bacterium]|nr:hypothetical protein [Sandaracinaceae bacterium]
MGGLLRVADAARADGRAAEAASALSALLQHHASDPRAPMAAFSLARLRLDVLGQPEAALEAINLALRLGLPPSIRGGRPRAVSRRWRGAVTPRRPGWPRRPS